jgi:hypothetical protein
LILVGEIKIEGNTVIFQLRGVDKLLAIKSALRIPIEHIVGVSTERANWDPFKQLRVGGSYVPGVVKDGRYYDPKTGLLFYEMHNPENCVTVSLRDERYKKIIFEVQDKESAAKLLNDAIRKNG